MKLKDLIGYKIVDIAKTYMLGIEKLVIQKGKKSYLIHTNKDGNLEIEDFKELEEKA